MAKPSKPLPSDVDPEGMTVPPKRGKRKRRNRPGPDDELRAGAQDARTRADARPYPPGVILEDDGEGWLPTSDHGDDGIWLLQLADAFGTRSTAVIQSFFDQLRDLCGETWDEITQSWKTNETELNAAIAMVNDVAPENTQEAALAAQMVAIHTLQMRVTKQALNRGGHVFFKDAVAASKLAKTYTDQLDALHRMRGGAPQSTRHEIHVTKEEHVHYHDHRGGGENRGRPQGPRASTIEGRASMPRDREGDGAALPSPGDARKNGLPSSRREEPRRQKGQG